MKPTSGIFKNINSDDYKLEDKKVIAEYKGKWKILVACRKKKSYRRKSKLNKLTGKMELSYFQKIFIQILGMLKEKLSLHVTLIFKVVSIDWLTVDINALLYLEIILVLLFI